MRIFRLACLVLISFVGIHCTAGRGMAAGEPGKTGGQSEEMFQKEITKTVGLRYLLYLPKDYGEDKERKWPVMLFLHGAGERGNDINKVKVHRPPKLIEQCK